MTYPDVPIGGEGSSTMRRLIGVLYEFSFPIKDHVQLGKDLDLFDFDAAAEVIGSKFYYLKNAVVLLEMGLINWTVSEVTKKGFTPLTTPEIVRSSIVEKCGFQPRGSNTQAAAGLAYLHSCVDQLVSQETIVSDFYKSVEDRAKEGGGNIDLKLRITINGVGAAAASTGTSFSRVVV